MGREKRFVAVTSSLPSSLLPLICGIVLLVNVAGVVRRHCGAKRAQKTGKVFCWQWFLKSLPSCVPFSHDSAGVRAVVVMRALLGIFPCSSRVPGRGEGAEQPAFLLLVFGARCARLPPGLVPGLKVLWVPAPFPAGLGHTAQLLLRATSAPILCGVVVSPCPRPAFLRRL